MTKEPDQSSKDDELERAVSNVLESLETGPAPRPRSEVETAQIVKAFLTELLRELTGQRAR